MRWGSQQVVASSPGSILILKLAFCLANFNIKIGPGDEAKQVASHTRSLPHFHGTTEMPSGRLSSHL